MPLNNGRIGKAGLIRRVRATREESPLPYPGEEDDSGSENSATNSEEVSVDRISEDGDENAQSLKKPPSVSKVTFGDLVQAQEMLPSLKRKQGHVSSANSKEKSDQAAHQDVAHMRAETSRLKSASDQRGGKVSDTIEEGGSENEAAPRLSRRAAREAPEEISSKKPVSWRRKVVSGPKRSNRVDPRFDPLVVGDWSAAQQTMSRKNYAFIDEIKEKETTQLRETIKKTKDAELKEQLKRQLMSSESQRKAREQKLREQMLAEEHRQKEKELVKQGKKPFYLKRSEQKKRLLLDQYQSLGEKQREKLVERRRKKLASKERKTEAFITRRS